MHVYRMTGPGGEVMETTAPSERKAKSNFRFRLMYEFGMSAYDAREYDYSDLEEVS